MVNLSLTESNQTEPEGKPALDVAIFFIERLFTNVAHDLSAEIQEPSINALQKQESLLNSPPAIKPPLPDAILHLPFITVEHEPDALLR